MVKINDNILYWFTTPTEKVFQDYHKWVVYPDNPFRRYIYIDTNSPVLFVAHLDTVQDLLTKEKILVKDNRIYTTGLDDRLGAYLIFKLFNLGIKGDILLTDHEEIGRSTAKYFSTSKSYNWVCEFDKTGKGFVTYGNDSNEFNELLIESGFQQGEGIQSDINEITLDNTPCMFNIGIGIVNPHSEESYVVLEDLEENIKKFIEFYKEYSETYFKSKNDNFFQRVIKRANELTR